MPSRPICDFCLPDRNDKLKELPYFIHDLRLNVHFHSDKDFKVRHRTRKISLANAMKKNPDILLKSKNYEETFVKFSEENVKELYLQLFN